MEEMSGRDRTAEAQSWAQRLSEARDWRSLAAVFNTADPTDREGQQQQRVFARKALLQAGGEAVLALTEQLGLNGVGRDHLAEILTKIGDAAAVQPLLRRFGDLSANVSDLVASFLARVGGREAAEGLSLYLNADRRHTRQSAAYGLGLLGTEQMAEPLRAALDKHGASISKGLAKSGTRFAASVIAEWQAQREALKARSKAARVAAITGSDVKSMTEVDMVLVLEELCRAWTDDDKVAIQTLEPLATEIGEELHRRGGFDKMLEVFYLLGWRPGRRTLEMHWSGIGEWL
jgi:HEAT repeat protein